MEMRQTHKMGFIKDFPDRSAAVFVIDAVTVRICIMREVIMYMDLIALMAMVMVDQLLVM